MMMTLKLYSVNVDKEEMMLDQYYDIVRTLNQCWWNTHNTKSMLVTLKLHLINGDEKEVTIINVDGDTELIWWHWNYTKFLLMSKWHKINVNDRHDTH